LHTVAKKGYLRITSELLQIGVAINATTIEEETSFFLAAHKDHVKIIKLLCDFGAEVDKPDNNMITPVLCALDLDVVDLLLEKGATPPQGKKN
jgi:ankyrin repeat protein